MVLRKKEYPIPQQQLQVQQVQQSQQPTVDKDTEKKLNKVSEIIRKAKARAVQSEVVSEKIKTDEIDKEKQKLEEIKRKERQEFDKDRERLEKQLEETEVYCPTCSEGNHDHKHILKPIEGEGGKLKCTGDDCKSEFALVDLASEYFCQSCHLPHKKPATKEEQDKDSCVFCGDNNFMKSDGFKEFDYKLIRQKVANRKHGKSDGKIGILDKISQYGKGESNG